MRIDVRPVVTQLHKAIYSGQSFVILTRTEASVPLRHYTLPVLTAAAAKGSNLGC